MGDGRLITFLMTAQLALCGFLLLRVFAVEERIVRLADAASEPAGQRVLVPDTAAPKPANSHLVDDRVREVIRGEIDAALVRLSAPAPATTDAGMTDTTSPPARELPDFDYERQFQAVEQSLSYYVQIGRITESEMTRLQSDIAVLRPSERTAMLGRLIRALNEGTLEGRL